MMKHFDRNAACPLDGVRVLDLSRVVAGNMLSLLLADFGAEVIKIEPPEGDALRDWLVAKMATNWKVYARNKKSVCLNLRKTEGRELLLRLVETANVLLENFRPGTLEKMGLGPDVLLARNPKLVIVRISGWGQTGPYRHKPGFGTLAEGMSGFAAMNGFADREPVLPPMQLADCTAGLYGAYATLIALRHVEVSGGHGQVIDLPLLEPLFSCMGPQAASYKASGKVRERTGSRSTTAAPRNAYKTKDGKMGLPVGLDATDDRARVPRHRQARPDREPALPDQRRARETRRRTRRHHRRVHRKNARWPKISRSSTSTRSRSARSTTFRRFSTTRMCKRARWWSSTRTTKWDRCRCIAWCRACRKPRARSARRRPDWASIMARSCPGWD